MSTYREFRVESRRRKRRRGFQKFGLMLLIFVILCALAWFIVRLIQGPSQKPVESVSTPVSSAPSAAAEASPAPTAAPTPTVGQSDLWDKIEGTEQTINTFGIASASAKMLALPENGQVDLTYFANAVFFGDSITTGWPLYSTSIQASQVVAEKSVSPPVNGAAWQDSTTKEIYDPIARLVALAPQKIYMMFGTNTLVNQAEATEDKLVADYGTVIDTIRAQLPGVEIYVQSILYPTAEGAAEKPGLSVDRISRVNDRLAALAAEKNCYYLDVASLLCRDNVLNWDIAQPDGIHVKSDGYRAWLEYLQKHTAYNPTSAFVGGSSTALLSTAAPEVAAAPAAETPAPEAPADPAAVPAG